MITVMHGLAVVMMFGSAAGLLIGYVWMLVAAYRVSLGWFLGVLLFSGVCAPLFLIMRWDEAKAPFLTTVASVVVMFAGLTVGDRADHMEQLRQEREAIMNGQEG
ncbi:MAG TPA: hypothetical protein VFA20_09345 [Myxococcaceae bacterium]|nr:hypothetical protein [Myxococcaceae bacterium]